jgi:hypothetical protein
VSVYYSGGVGGATCDGHLGQAIRDIDSNEGGLSEPAIRWAGMYLKPQSNELKLLERVDSMRIVTLNQSDC